MGEGMLLKSLFQLQELQENLRTVKKKQKKIWFMKYWMELSKAHLGVIPWNKGISVQV